MSVSKYEKDTSGYVQVAVVVKLLHTIALEPELCGKSLRDELNVSKMKMYRLIRAARDDFGVDVDWQKDGSLPGRGRYIIRDWGILNENKIKEL